jgi:uncharacterized protein
MKDISNLISKAVKEDYVDAEVILFGSRARNEAKDDSDWDILVLLNQVKVTYKDEQAIRHKLFEIEVEKAEAISTFVYSKDDWNTRHKITPLYENIKKEGLIL